jgi:hypothetical protein
MILYTWERTSTRESEKKRQEIGNRRGKRESKDQVENAEGKKEKKLIEETRGRRRGMGLYSYQEGNSDRLSNRGRKSMRKSRRIQNRGKNRLGPSPGETSIEGTNHEEKGKGRAKEEQRKGTIKIWNDQEVEEDRKRQENARCEEQEVENRKK